ncbi:hypothetical protein V8G54_001975 [Vigna mungo]|uniref:Uncharacterized protein n=1 Tax=Vigna mungo TaxID=3915 RepID=A0AAQ3SC08_VIGMU
MSRKVIPHPSRRRFSNGLLLLTLVMSKERRLLLRHRHGGGLHNHFWSSDKAPHLSEIGASRDGPLFGRGGGAHEGGATKTTSFLEVSSSVHMCLPRMKGVGARSCDLWSEAEEGKERGAELAAHTERETKEKLAGMVPVLVAAMMEGSAWRRSHSMV